MNLRKLLFLVTFIPVILSFDCCKRCRVDYLTEYDANDSTTKFNFNDSVVNFCCFSSINYYPFQYNTIIINFHFNTNKIYNVDSLFVGTTLANNQKLKLYSFSSVEENNYYAEYTPAGNNIMVDIQKIVDANPRTTKRNIIKNRTPEEYRFIFTNDNNSIKNNYITVTIKITLSEKQNILRYNKTFTLYPKQKCWRD